ncbi:hypothetical protein [Rhodococcus sp. RS1C4]|nr:hypothetical protein [Rhodococcus sp. RS1C4]
MTRADVMATKSVFVLRMIDQGMWSLGFFALNLAAGIALPVDQFASLSVAAAIGFIAVGASRAWGVNSAMVAAARFGVSPETSIDRWSAWRGACLFATVAGLIVFGWVGRSGDIGQAAVLGALAALLVVSDLPRQVLIIRGGYVRAAMLSGIYVVFGVVGSLAFRFDQGFAYLLTTWCVGLVLILTVGIAFCGDETTDIGFESRIAFAWRMTAEALYLGVGSQIATLLLYLAQDDEATAGIRFAYALVFAPAFVVIQGLQPLIFKHVARISAVGPRAAAAACMKWNVVVAVGLAVCGVVGGVILSTVFAELGPNAAVPYIVPVGIAILSAQMFDAALLGCRFFMTPVVIHRARLVSVLADVGFQGLGVALGGAGGLIVALVVTSGVRVIISTGMLLVLPRVGRPVEPSALQEGQA